MIFCLLREQMCIRDSYNAAQELYTRVQNSLARRREEDEEDD